MQQNKYILSLTIIILPLNATILVANNKTPEMLIFVLFFITSDWSEEAVSSAEILRMIYQGRFLHGNVTLAGKSNEFL